MQDQESSNQPPHEKGLDSSREESDPLSESASRLLSMNQGPEIRRSCSFTSSPFTTRLHRATDIPLSLRHGLASIQGNRKTQEDAHRNVPEMERPPKEQGIKDVDTFPFAFFGIYDGHGGDTASEYICQNLHLRFAELLKTVPHDESERATIEELRNALRAAILRVEKDWMEDAAQTKDCSGSTLAVVVIKDNTMLVANVGDSEVILCEEGKAVTVTEYHNPKGNPAEVERVKAVGGSIFRDRVAHPVINPAVMSIAVSRAIGDYGFKAPEFTNNKPSGLTAEPFIAEVALRPEKHAFCIIACDGVWDVVKPQEAVDFVSKKLGDPSLGVEEIAKLLVDHAYAQGSMDNISATVVLFDWSSPAKMSLDDVEEKDKERDTDNKMDVTTTGGTEKK